MLGHPLVLSSLPPRDNILSAEGGTGIGSRIQAPLTKTFEIAGKKGCNLLTALLNLDISTVSGRTALSPATGAGCRATR
jgi:hypothetical protein